MQEVSDPIAFLEGLGLHDVPLNGLAIDIEKMSVSLRTANLNANWEDSERRPCELVFTGVTGLSLHVAPLDGIWVGRERITRAPNCFVVELSLAQAVSPLDPSSYGFVKIAFASLKLVDLARDGA